MRCPLTRALRALGYPLRLAIKTLHFWRDRGLAYTLPRAIRAARRHA